MGIDVLKLRSGIFLDRDGVINLNVLNPATRVWESPLAADDLIPALGALAAMRRLQSAGYLLFVVSNQPNYAKGKASLETLNAIHDRLLGFLREADVSIASFYYCLHHPQGTVPGYSGPCQCRKPSPQFLLQARDTFSLDFANSWMIGDRTSDVECGRRAGVRTVRILNLEEGAEHGDGISSPDFTAVDLSQAAALILTASQR